MRASRIVRTTALILLTASAVAALGALIMQDQFAKHRRDLFSSRGLQRFAALGYLSGLTASVEAVQLLRDFIAWETRALLKRRALQILGRMEEQLGQGAGAATECAG
jgi:hypothetical protein